MSPFNNVFSLVFQESKRKNEMLLKEKAIKDFNKTKISKEKNSFYFFYKYESLFQKTQLLFGGEVLK